MCTKHASVVPCAPQDHVARKAALTKKALSDAVDSVRGAVMICYPMGLPEWDLVRLLLEDKEGDVGAQVRCRQCTPMHYRRLASQPRQHA